jgi:predicted DNA-binding transcriptional regulator YafY
MVLQVLLDEQPVPTPSRGEAIDHQSPEIDVTDVTIAIQVMASENLPGHRVHGRCGNPVVTSGQSVLLSHRALPPPGLPQGWLRILVGSPESLISLGLSMMISMLGYSLIVDAEGRTHVGHSAESEPMESEKKPKDVAKKRHDKDRRLRQAARFARILTLLELLQSRVRHNAGSLARELKVSPRTVQRDLDVLELAGIPCLYIAEQGGYVLSGDYRFAVTGLTSDELLGQATATAMTSAKGLDVGKGAAPTTRKLQATGHRTSPNLLADALRVTAVLDLKLADHEGHRDAIKVIQESLVGKNCLEGVYLSPYQKIEKRLVLHPIRLCLVKQAWYLVARPDGSDHPVTYRVQRFRSIRRLDLSSEVPADFDLGAYFGNAWAVYRGEKSYDVEVRFTPEAAPLVTETTWHHTQQTRRNDDGSVTLSFQVDGLEEIVWWVLGWSSVVEVLRPPELRATLLSHLKQAVAMNGG